MSKTNAVFPKTMTIITIRHGVVVVWGLENPPLIGILSFLIEVLSSHSLLNSDSENCGVNLNMPFRLENVNLSCIKKKNILQKKLGNIFDRSMKCSL